MDTESWFVANASDKDEIDILSPFALDHESSHSSKEFVSILKHEFTHILSDTLSNKAAIPKWLGEGVAAYVAKQHKNDSAPIYFEENFCKKLSTAKGWDDHVNHGAYTIAALFVAFLVRKYSFAKILTLITSLNKNYYYSGFKDIFESIYKIDIKDLEEIFIKEINNRKGKC